MLRSAAAGPTDAPLLSRGYTFTNGPALLRVACRLTPAEAAEYAAAFRS